MTRALFGPVAQDAQDDLEEDCRVLGLDPGTIPKGAQEDEGVWPQHVPAVRAFLTVAGQWRTVPHGLDGVRYLGLDYGAAKAGFDLSGLEVGPDLWAEVRVIEAAAAAALNGKE